MPTSLTPPPHEDQTECGNCGAYIYHDLVKCPHCGVYLVDPGESDPEPPLPRPTGRLGRLLQALLRRARREPHPAEELFTGALREAALFDELLRKVGGDRAAVERLIEYERRLRPDATRLTCLRQALVRWQHDNQ